MVHGVYANSTTETFSVIGMIKAVKKKKAQESENSPVKESEEIPMLGSSTVALYNFSLDGDKRGIVSTRWNFLMLKLLEGKKDKVK